jgi:hypothetical protein
MSSLLGQLGEVENDPVWLLNAPQNCWINEQDVQRETDITRNLPFCATPEHFVGGLQAQYSRQDCYEGLTLDAPSKNLGTAEYIDVQCQMFGETNRGNK